MITKARSKNILSAENVVERILEPILWVGELESISIRNHVPDNLIGNKELFENIDLFAVETCPGGCGFQSKKPSAFTQHLQSIRTCYLCAKEFHGKYAKKDLVRHLHKHKKEERKKQPLRCESCHRTFQFKSKLKTHLTNGPCGRTDFGARFLGWE